MHQNSVTLASFEAQFTSSGVIRPHTRNVFSVPNTIASQKWYFLPGDLTHLVPPALILNLVLLAVAAATGM